MEILKYELQEETRKGARIKVLGIGGGGTNAVGRMYEEGLEGVEFYVMNTDAQALEASKVPNKVQIGVKVTGGLGAGSDPAIGRQAALEDTERILAILEGADLVFVTAGLGGGTGAGASPVIATLAKELDALTIAVVTKPFTFEGGKRMRQAERSVSDLASSVDILTTIPNDRLLTIAPKGASMAQAFRMADDILRQAVQGISEIILTPGLINLDFSDIKAAISGMGHALIGTAIAKGSNAAVEAARGAINSPLLEDTQNQRRPPGAHEHHGLRRYRAARTERSLFDHPGSGRLRRPAIKLRRNRQRSHGRLGQSHRDRNRLREGGRQTRIDCRAETRGGVLCRQTARPGAAAALGRGGARPGCGCPGVRRGTRCTGVPAPGQAPELKRGRPCIHGLPPAGSPARVLRSLSPLSS